MTIRSIFLNGVITLLCAVITVALVRGVRYAYEYFSWKHTSGAADHFQERPELLFGTQLSLNGAALTSSTLSLVIATRSECPFCLKSAAFHAALISKAKTLGHRVIVAVPSASERKFYASQLAFAEGEIHEWGDLNTRIRYTPTVLLVDHGGRIRRAWHGVMGAAHETAIRNLIEDPELLGAPDSMLETGEANLRDEDLIALSKRRTEFTIIDPGPRLDYMAYHRDGAVNIPASELGARAPFELDKRRLHIVDCAMTQGASCRSAMVALAKNGIRAAALNADRVNVNRCQRSPVRSNDY